MKAIETIWKGYRFRSRLEARWAIFFEHLGMTWEYEPEGFHLSNGQKYLPDFRLITRNDISVWVEIKPLGFRGPDKMGVLKMDFEKETKNESLDSFITLIGDPVYVFGGETKVCPRCGVIAEIQVDPWIGNDVFFTCYDCDFHTPCGSGNKIEAGLLAPTKPYKGVLIVEERDYRNYKAKIDAACTASRSARFEHGETA